MVSCGLRINYYAYAWWNCAYAWCFKRTHIKLCVRMTRVVPTYSSVFSSLGIFKASLVIIITYLYCHLPVLVLDRRVAISILGGTLPLPGLGGSGWTITPRGMSFRPALGQSWISWHTMEASPFVITSVRGGGILPILCILLVESWPSLLMTSSD